MSAAPHSGALDENELRRFVEIIHGAATHALADYPAPGLLQLVTIPPDGGPTGNRRFPIGAVDAMVLAAIDAARAGANVYVEGRTLAPDAPGRGDAAATRYVFAFVDDSDGDKGKAGTLALQPSLTVETSPGNRHAWLFLDIGIPVGEADRIGRAMRAAVGSDSATAKLTQPYRIAGTRNYPDAHKRARGRVVEATRILAAGGPVYSPTQLAEAFPAVEHEARVDNAPSGRSGRSDSTVAEMAAELGGDRSSQFFKVVLRAVRAGMLPDDLEDVFRLYPGGCGAKYLEPDDRLAEEIRRAWLKAKALTTQPVLPPHYPDRAVPIDAARAAMREAIRAAIAAGSGCRAVKAGTGIGKSRITVELAAADIRARRAAGDRSRYLYAVPTHRLGDEVAALFTAEGVTARVFRGRSAKDPDLDGTDACMCLDLMAVGLAQAAGARVSSSCCKGDDPSTGKAALCPLFNRCGYQRQLSADPDVWVVPHQLLFRAPSRIDRIAAVIIDESFWSAGMRSAAKWGVTLDEIAAAPVGRHGPTPSWATIATHRAALARALRLQDTPGGVERRHLVAGGLTAAICASAQALEWQAKVAARMWPGMDQKERQQAADAAFGFRHIHHMVAAWRASATLLQDQRPDAVSGHLVLGENETPMGRARAVRTRGLRSIAPEWADLPTLILDATLPDLAVLQQFYPGVEVVAEVEAKAPHARVRQVLSAPVSAAKLLNSDGERNLKAIRWAILRRYVDAGRGPTLVVAQKDVSAWLDTVGLPRGVQVLHFNAVAGLDGFKDVRLLIVIGRTMPNPLAIEADAGALTGFAVPTLPPSAKGFRWYQKAFAGLRLADGGSFAVEVDRHPDPMAEALRWQAAEAEVMQAIGRARAVNRTPADPVDIEVWNDLVLPLTIDEVAQWESVPHGPEAEMLAAGIGLESPSDIAACWPSIWPTAKAARHWQRTVTGGGIPIEIYSYRDSAACELRYQHRGSRQRWRIGWHVPAVMPDPRAWLEARLGQLAAFEITSPEPSH